MNLKTRRTGALFLVQNPPAQASNAASPPSASNRWLR
jgi:hypothetical protein